MMHGQPSINKSHKYMFVNNSTIAFWQIVKSRSQ